MVKNTDKNVQCLPYLVDKGIIIPYIIKNVKEGLVWDLIDVRNENFHLKKNRDKSKVTILKSVNTLYYKYHEEVERPNNIELNSQYNEELGNTQYNHEEHYVVVRLGNFIAIVRIRLCPIEEEENKVGLGKNSWCFEDGQFIPVLNGNTKKMDLKKYISRSKEGSRAINRFDKGAKYDSELWCFPSISFPVTEGYKKPWDLNGFESVSNSETILEILILNVKVKSH